jgi:hypothetical protein
MEIVRKQLWIGYFAFVVLGIIMFINNNFGLTILCSCLGIKLQWDIYSLTP